MCRNLASLPKTKNELSDLLELSFDTKIGLDGQVIYMKFFYISHENLSKGMIRWSSTQGTT